MLRTVVSIFKGIPILIKRKPIIPQGVFFLINYFHLNCGLIQKKNFIIYIIFVQEKILINLIIIIFNFIIHRIKT